MKWKTLGQGPTLLMDTLSVQITESEKSFALTRLENMLMVVQLLVLVVLNLYGKFYSCLSILEDKMRGFKSQDRAYIYPYY